MCEMKATGKSKIFLPAERNGLGDIRMAGLPKAVNIFFTVAFLLADAYIFKLIPIRISTEFNWTVATIYIFLIVGSAYAITRIWRLRVIFTDQHVKFQDLNGSQMVRYEDIKTVGYIGWPSLYKQILIYDKIEQRYGIPFGGVGTNEIAELLIRKCGLQRCEELNDKLELIKKSEKAEKAG